MQQLLTGRTRLPGFSGEWEVKRLGDVLDRMANGAVYKPTTSFGLPITRIETIASGVIDFSRVGYTAMGPELEKYRIEKGDILFSHINSLDHIGKVAFFEDERQLYHGMNLLLLRTNEKNNGRFLYFWLTSEPGRRQTRILAKQAVNQASIIHQS
jgi:type I restriction enzyme S subunit